MEILCALKTSSFVCGQSCVLLLWASLWSSASLCQGLTNFSSLVASSFSSTYPTSEYQQTQFSTSLLMTSSDSVLPLSGTVTPSDKSVQPSNVLSLETSEFLWSSFGAFPTLAPFIFVDQTLSSDVLMTRLFFAETSTGFNLPEEIILPPLSTLESTVFLDSVAISRRWDLLDDFTHSLLSLKIIPSSTILTEEVSFDKQSDSGYSGSVILTHQPATWYIHETDNLSVALVAEALTAELTTAAPFLPALTSSETNMFSNNSTHSQLIGFSGTDGMEATSLGSWGSTPVGNSSCQEQDSGCIEFHWEEEDSARNLRIKVIVGVTCGALLLLILAVLLFWFMRRQRGKMSSGSKIDLSSYWDDSVTLSYINGHIEIPKDSTDEMVSLDNDSFLNSLDSMSFTNTWNSDSSKRTNF